MALCNPLETNGDPLSGMAGNLPPLPPTVHATTTSLLSMFFHAQRQVFYQSGTMSRETSPLFSLS